ncbi:MAG: TraB/GumN family protein [Phycisphaerae bacterium]|nr:TraB/GumN family protein [Phycisphaerae bacterium]
MSESELELPERVTRLEVDGKAVYIVGTAHVSKQSVDDVIDTVAAVGPDSICIELCEGRYRSLVERDNWKKMDLFKVLKQGKALFLLVQLIMSSFYRKLGKKLGVEPGAEMLEGAKQAEATGAELVLADRDIEVTLKRVWGYLNFWNKFKMLGELLAGLIFGEKIDEELVENMKQKDQLESIMEVFAKSFPEVKRRLIDERDVYLAQKIRSAPGEKIVAVVGAAHVPGIKEHIYKDEPLDELMVIPPKSIIPKILKWLIPALIVFLFARAYYTGGFEKLMDNLMIWVLVNGTLSAIGAAIAFGHPLTIIVSFFSAPLTSLNPMIAASFVAGIVQTWVKKPTVADFEDIPNAISTVKGFWSNTVTRILLVFILVTLGSALGTWISAAWIIAA